MGIYINILAFLLILGLILIYRKSDESENYLFIKLVGYYLLGSFKFNLNKLAIPLGFIICIIFFRPKINFRSKRYAALLGLVFFIIGLAIPSISKYLYERPREIPVSSVNINTINLQRDWQLIKKELEINDDTKIQEFNVSYENDGTIRDMRYELITYKEEGLVHYSIDLLPSKKKYIIRPSKIKEWLQYNRLITAERLFEVMPTLNLIDMRGKRSHDWYSITTGGELINYDLKGNEKFIIVSKDNLREISNDELPMRGFCILTYGMEMISQSPDCTSYESKGGIDYLFDVIND